MTTQPKDPHAVIEQLVTALEAGPSILHTYPDAAVCLCSQCEFVRLRGAALTAGREALEQKCKYGNPVAACTSAPMDCQCAIDSALAQTEPEPVAEVDAEMAKMTAPSTAGELATIAGLEASIGHLSSLVNQQLILLSDVNDTCGLDGYGGELNDGESEIIDRVRAHLAAMEPPARDTKAIVQQSAALLQSTPDARPVGELTEGDLMKCIAQAGCYGTVKLSYEIGPYGIDKPTLNATKLARAILAAARTQPERDRQ